MQSFTGTAMATWRGCVGSNNRPTFPYPTMTPLWNAYFSRLNVKYNSGFNPNKNTSCGSTSGNTINVYQVAFKPGTTTTVTCSTYGYDQIIAHELGHYYGLADITDSGCSDIMAQLDGSPHYVGTDDCTMADSQNQTYSENNPIDGSCQQPCYTTCVGGSCPAQNGGSPIIFDLDDDGFRLSGPDDPVYFDLYTDGVPVWTAWTARGSGTAFLALDLNGNGKIDDAGELFGDHTRLMDGTFATDGFEALAQYDEVINGGNADGVIDAADAIFDKLRVWTDSNHNGQTDPGELRTLSQAGIVAIDLKYHLAKKTDRYGNRFRYRGHAVRQSDHHAHKVTIYDVFFVPAQAPVSASQACVNQPATPASLCSSLSAPPRQTLNICSFVTSGRRQ
ncbi:MAG TPA: hypothetical protein VHR45_21710 [Thermoanaerobaculia bacterium]|nr:hypothetical protein [Thermoanaerobaculia bacterium]